MRNAITHSIFRSKNVRMAFVFIAIAAQLFFVFAHPLLARAGDGADNAAGTNTDTVNPKRIEWTDLLSCQWSSGAAGAAFIPILGPAISGITTLSQCGHLLKDYAAQTVQDFGNFLKDPIDTIFKNIFSLIATVTQGIAQLEVAFIVLLANPNVFKFATAPFVHTGWYVCLQIANMLIVLGLIILANRFILGMESFGNYKALQEYVIAALFLNFSLTIASLFIGVSNFLTLAFLNLTGSPTSAHPTQSIALNFGDRLAKVFESLAQFNETSAGGITAVANMLVLVFLSMAIMIILGAIAFSFLKRIVFLWAYLIIMPLAYVIGKLSEVGGVLGGVAGGDPWKKWQKDFTKELVFGPVMAFFLWLTLLVMGNISSAYTTTEATMVESNILLLVQHILEPIIFIALLAFGFKTASDTAGGGFGLAEKAMNKVTQEWPKNLAMAPVNRAKDLGVATGTGILQTSAVQDLKSWGARNSKHGLWGGLARGITGSISGLEERAKKPAQTLVDTYTKRHGLEAIDDTSVLLKHYQVAENQNDTIAMAAIAKRTIAVGGYKAFAGQVDADGKPKFNIGKLKQVMAAGGQQDFKDEELHKENPMLMPRGTEDEKTAFKKYLGNATAEDIKKWAKVDPDGALAKELAEKVDSADKVMAFAQGYGKAGIIRGNADITRQIHTAGGFDNVSVSQAKELLMKANDMGRGFTKALLEKLYTNLDSKEKESLVKTRAIAGLIGAYFGNPTDPTRDGIAYFVNSDSTPPRPQHRAGFQLPHNNPPPNTP